VVKSGVGNTGIQLCNKPWSGIHYKISTRWKGH